MAVARGAAGAAEPGPHEPGGEDGGRRGGLWHLRIGAWHVARSADKGAACNAGTVCSGGLLCMALTAGDVFSPTCWLCFPRSACRCSERTLSFVPAASLPATCSPPVPRGRDTLRPFPVRVGCVCVGGVCPRPRLGILTAAAGLRSQCVGASGRRGWVFLLRFFVGDSVISLVMDTCAATAALPLAGCGQVLGKTDANNFDSLLNFTQRLGTALFT